jgi:hypothetical protein
MWIEQLREWAKSEAERKKAKSEEARRDYEAYHKMTELMMRADPEFRRRRERLLRRSWRLYLQREMGWWRGLCRWWWGRWMGHE